MPVEVEARPDWLQEQRSDHLRFLVAFTQLDLDALRPGQQVALLETMALIASGFPQDIPDRMPKISVKTAKALQHELRDCIDALRQARPYVIKGLRVDRILSISPRVEGGRKVFHRPVGSHYQS